MKKTLKQIITLSKFKTEVLAPTLDELDKDGSSAVFLVLFQDHKWEMAYGKEDLLSILRQDHIRPVSMVFNRNDKYKIDRDILVRLEGED